MKRLHRSLVVGGLAAAVVLSGVGAAQAAEAAPAGTHAAALAGAADCDVEFTVTYYHYRENGYSHGGALRRANKAYAKCMAS
ncbi:hypothetical protein ACFV4F_42285 [Kitasatospora sp. NPDC059722]|uniref:hypothetical protein n=1 Tax=unclassified Kitasatospora TaxID=2633591 RepID=UPI00364CB6DF